MVLVTRRQARLQEESQGDISLASATTEPVAGGISNGKEIDQQSEASSSSTSIRSSSNSSDTDESDSEESSSSGIDSIDAEDEADMDKLFEETLKACQALDEQNSTKQNQAFETNADLIALDRQAVKGVEAKVNSLKDEIERRPDDVFEKHFDRLKRGDDLGDRKPKSDGQSRKERRIEREKTAGSKWFDMPAFPKKERNAFIRNSKGKRDYSSSSRGPTADEMTKQIQAIRLRNAMDPKRFYRGGNGVSEKGMPAFAQMGRIISSNTEPASTMSRSERGKNVIDELIKDADNAAYTKRKFSEHQSRTDVGRSSHISKRKGNNAGKKQRR